MTGPAVLLVDICGYWTTGSGTGRGLLVDRACARDADGLPYLPGRHLKGLLRDAVRRARLLGMPMTDGTAWPEDAERLLFGVGGRGGSYPDSSGQVAAGLLEVRDGRLPVADRDAFRGNLDATAALTRLLHQSAMHETRHVARQGSLRVTEVAVPMRLEAPLGLAPFADAGLPPGASGLVERWPEALADVFCLVEAVGGGRRHGLGRAVLAWRDP